MSSSSLSKYVTNTSNSFSEDFLWSHLKHSTGSTGKVHDNIHALYAEPTYNWKSYTALFWNPIT